MVTTGMMTARKVPRNRKITTITMTIASISVCSTSSIEASTNLATSKTLSTFRSAGATRWMSGISAFTALTISRDRKRVVWGEGVSVRVDLGGSRIIKKKKRNKRNTKTTQKN